MNGKQNGNGTFHFQNGDKYSGDFKDGLFSGQGRMIYSNGETYEGEFKDGQIYVFKKAKRRLLGQILNQNQINKISFILCIAFIIYYGHGKFTYSPVKINEGEYKDGQNYGKSILTFKKQQTYNGEWLYDEENCKWAFSFSNGDKYSGDFKDGLFSGQGKMTCSNGDNYEGKFNEPINLLKDSFYFFENFL